MSGDVHELLAPGGALAARLPGFEERPSQIEMAKAVERTLRDGGRLLVEAGTGTGKTFAYLLPALRHADLPDRRVVISTWTRNLQQQLVERDLPLLRELLGVPFEAALVQGRENYVCRRRAEASLVQHDLWLDSRSTAAQLRRLVEWAATSPEGTRGSLDFEPRAEAWAAVKAERGNCLNARSPYFATCVWQEAKRRARESAVLVVNHALLLADLVLRRGGGAVLPPYSMLIVDEAHHLEEVAAAHLGGRATRAAALALLRDTGRALDGAEIPSRAALDRALAGARAAAVELFDAVRRWLGARPVAALERAAALPRGLALALQELHDELHAAAPQAGNEASERELLARGDSALELAETLDAVLEGSSKEFVCYAEALEERGDVALCAAPVEPGPILARELFAPLHAAVLTSATLAVSPPPDRFAWIRRGSGLHGAEALELPSPFDYRRQARLVIDPLPEPGEPEAWLAAMVRAIPEHVRRTGGGAFVLFTSRKTMLAVADGAGPAIEGEGFTLLVQGRGMPRAAMLDRFRAGQPAVLFGLASFWEGVDVPGRELRHVILTRLPFPVPDHPLERARGEVAKAAGLDPFWSLSLPQAVLRFKQGFGRLIRRRDDEGTVTVLDARLIRRGYGRVFLAALPELTTVVMRDGEEVPLDRGDAP